MRTGLNVLKKMELDRFWKKVVKTPDCWFWVGTKNGRGYGMFYIQLHGYRAHRLSWMIANKKPLKERQQVCHSCDNPGCINPDHLWVGTARDNSHDCIAKGRNSPPPVKKEYTHCKWGHRFTKANSYVYEKFGRMCKTCTKKRSKIRKRRLKMEKLKCNLE